SRPAAADGALGDNPTPLAAQVPHRRLLDDVPALWHFDLKRGVIEVVGGTSLDPRCERFVNAPVEPDGVTPSAERQPVELDRSHVRSHESPSFASVAFSAVILHAPAKPRPMAI